MSEAMANMEKLGDGFQYSETEQWTGKYWIDGKKIYCKGVSQDISNYVITGAQRNFSTSHGISISSFIILIGQFSIVSGTYYTGNKYYLVTSPTTELTTITYAPRFNATDIGVILPNSWGTTKVNIQFVMFYTKTT